MTTNLKKTFTHIAAIAVMLIAACVYFSPALSGDIVYQGDMQKADAMAHQQRMAADSTGTIPNWAPGMFSGMPGYQIASEPQRSVFTPLKSLLILRPFGVERNIGVLWLYLIGFYVAMIAFGCGPWISLLTAMAFGLGSYNIIIVEAGHITKAWAMAMIAPVLAGMVLALRAENGEQRAAINWRQLVWGVVLFTLALGLQITFNHIQITFYTAIGGIIIGLTYLVYALKERWFKQFLCIVGILLVGCAFAVGGNYRHLAVNQEYAKATMRGGSEITVKPHDLGLEDRNGSETNQSGGLDINYAFSWSYGIGETYTILVPGAMGGGSGERVSEDSEWMHRTGQRQAPLYWGSQPFTSGPVYFGAIVVFLFILGCFVVRGPERWWLIIATLIAIVMSWGRNFLPFNEFLFNHLPLYNKFRTPSMSLVLANAAMAIMAALTLKTVFEKRTKNEEVSVLNKSLFGAGGIVAGILIVGIIVAKTKLTFSGGSDVQYQTQMGDQWSMFQSLLTDERRSLFMRDSWRSLGFVALAFATIWLYINNKLKKSGIALALIGVFVVIDLWGVDRRYLNDENFVSPERASLYRTPAEQLTDQIATANGDSDYRIYDLTVNTFNDSRPSAFHNQIGGYSAAKLRRYQDLIDFYLGSQKFYDNLNGSQITMIGNMGGTPLLATDTPYPVLDMLNCRYFMRNFGEGQTLPVRRLTALGNCWLVDEVKTVNDANAEIQALNDFDPRHTAIIDKSKFDIDASQLTEQRDSSESIVLTHTYPQTPDHLTYKSHTNRTRLAVFSEVYYAPDWRAYIDGEPAKYIRANYILRAIVIPAGDHTITFVNEAPTLHRLDSITLIISILMLAAMAATIILVYRKKRE
ncbi:MAG: hypothetical protein J6031_02910 [Bacteroidales bacterium]|nr:hypothetical protein [Bacteroidales bacterium]